MESRRKLCILHFCAFHRSSNIETVFILPVFVQLCLDIYIYTCIDGNYQTIHFFIILIHVYSHANVCSFVFDLSICILDSIHQNVLTLQLLQLLLQVQRCWAVAEQSRGTAGPCLQQFSCCETFF